MSSPLVLLVLGQAYFIGPSFNGSRTELSTNAISGNINHEYTSTSGNGTHDIEIAVNNLLITITDHIKQETAGHNVEAGVPRTTEISGVPTDSTIPEITTSICTPSTTPVNPGTDSPPLSGDYKVVCYYTNWGLIRYLPEDIDYTLCTHIMLGYAVLDESDLVMRAHPSWMKKDSQFYTRLEGYKKHGQKVLLALGGWDDSAGDKYSRLVNSKVNRSKFVTHALWLIEEYEFDGLEVDWEWPVCWQGGCGMGPATDKEGFSLLLEELSSAFKPKGLLLTTKVGQIESYISKGYDLPLLTKYVDWITVVTYDYHGPWSGETLHGAPLYDISDKLNANYTIHYLISQGAPSRKIVMGLALYGRSFTLNDPTAGVGLHAPAAIAGEAGESSKSPGFMAYHEICDRIQHRGWAVVKDPLRRMGPYAYKGNQWVGFDDVDMIRRKAQYIRDMNLGGAMVKGLDLDDFKGGCGEGRHPLTHALQRVLADPPNGQTTLTHASITGEDIRSTIPGV